MNRIETRTKRHPKPIFTLDVTDQNGETLRLQFQDWSVRSLAISLLENERPDLTCHAGGPGLGVLGTARDGVELVNSFFRVQQTIKKAGW